MALTFRKEEEISHFYDPNLDWQAATRKTEVRYDPLTGETSRILYYPAAPLQPPDYAPLAQKTRELGCPFCPEHLERLTPRFVDQLLPEGRIRVGEAWVFPNLFPYGKHSAVGLFSSEHYVPLKQFTPRMLVDGFEAALQYLRAVVEKDPASPYLSVNWNYMPTAGASIIHPHLQIVATPHPTNYQQRTMKAAKRFYDQHHRSYYTALAEEEKERQERFLAADDQLVWVHAFAPLGQVDVVGVFRRADHLLAITEQELHSMARGLCALFQYLGDQNYASFNLALYIPSTPAPEYRVHVRVVSRATLGRLGTSDANYFKMLHNEPLSLKNPEEVAAECRPFFEKTVE